MGNENEISQTIENRSSKGNNLLKTVCRPFTIEIDRLDLPSNGVIIVKEDQGKKAEASGKRGYENRTDTTKGNEKESRSARKDGETKTEIGKGSEKDLRSGKTEKVVKSGKKQPENKTETGKIDKGLRSRKRDRENETNGGKESEKESKSGRKDCETKEGIGKGNEKELRSGRKQNESEDGGKENEKELKKGRKQGETDDSGKGNEKELRKGRKQSETDYRGKGNEKELRKKQTETEEDGKGNEKELRKRRKQSETEDSEKGNEKELRKGRKSETEDSEKGNEKELRKGRKQSETEDSEKGNEKELRKGKKQSETEDSEKGNEKELRKGRKQSETEDIGKGNEKESGRGRKQSETEGSEEGNEKELRKGRKIEMEDIGKGNKKESGSGRKSEMEDSEKENKKESKSGRKSEPEGSEKGDEKELRTGRKLSESERGNEKELTIGQKECEHKEDSGKGNKELTNTEIETEGKETLNKKKTTDLTNEVSRTELDRKLKELAEISKKSDDKKTEKVEVKIKRGRGRPRNNQNSELNKKKQISEETNESINNESQQEINLNENDQVTDKNNSFLTPSRVSNRLKNRKVKFDVLKLLAGESFDDDDEEEVAIKKPRKSKEHVEKTSSLTPVVKIYKSKSLQKQTTPEISPSAEDDEESDVEAVEKSSTTPLQGVVEKKIENVQDNANKESNDETGKNAEENSVGKEEILKPTNITTGMKISIKLKEPPKKQVVNISLPSLNNKLNDDLQTKNNLHVGFGPDILISRVKKSDKIKTVLHSALTQKNKKNNLETPMKTNESLRNEEENLSKDKTEKVPVQSEKNDNLMSTNDEEEEEEEDEEECQSKVQKNQLEKSTSDDLDSNTKSQTDSDLPPKSKKHKLEKIIAKTDTPESQVVVIFKQTNPSETGIPPPTLARKRKQNRVLFSKRKEDSPEPEYSVTESHSESIPLSPIRESPVPQPEEIVEEKREKKTAKVTPIQQSSPVKKSQIQSKPKPLNLKEQAIETFEVYPATDFFDYKDTFERYFTVEDKICEHNDSLDSDSSSEDADLLSHFIDLKDQNKSESTNKKDASGSDRKKTTESVRETPLEQKSSDPEEQIKSNENTTIYDLMQEISLELPAWNIHILPNGKDFCLVQLDNGPTGIPVMRKIIHFDDDYNAKVYINQSLVTELGGIYDSYESIKQLIYSVDHM